MPQQKKITTVSVTVSAAVLLACAALSHAQDQQTQQTQQAYPATLSGHAVLPAQSFVAAPKDAPADLQTSDPKRFTRSDWEHLMARAERNSQ